MIVSLIAAVAKNGVIGRNGDLPWNLPKDMRFFTKTTKGHHVLMGRKNYDSIPEKYRPLPARPNVVITRNPGFKADNVDVFNSIDMAIEFARSKNETEAFIIGGGDIYAQTIELADKLYITHVDATPDGDTFFPNFNSDEWEAELVLEQPVDTVHNCSFKTYVYTRIKR